METVIITGASKGIGFELANKFYSEGFNLILLSRNLTSLEKLDLDSLRVELKSVDLSNSDEILSFQNEIHDKEIKYLINNAGLLINKPFHELSESDWLQQFQVNVFGPVKLIKALLPLFQSNAHIVNISSMGGFQGSDKFPGLSAYSASKGAMSILTECLSVELAAQNISVNALCLGAVQTEMLEKAFPGYQAPISAIEMAEYIYHFTINSTDLMSGKIVPISKINPS